MQTTLNLLENALTQRNASEWAARLNLAPSALRTARAHGHLSPAIAGALADEMGEDSKKWIVIAALESERDSACKARMVRKLSGAFASVAVAVVAGGAAFFVAPSPAMAQITEPALYIMLSLGTVAAWVAARSKPGM